MKPRFVSALSVVLVAFAAGLMAVTSWLLLPSDRAFLLAISLIGVVLLCLLSLCIGLSFGEPRKQTRSVEPNFLLGLLQSLCRRNARPPADLVTILKQLANDKLDTASQRNRIRTVKKWAKWWHLNREKVEFEDEVG